jgi:hypothetical protein
MEPATRAPGAAFLFLSIYGVLACLAAPLILMMTVALSSVKTIQTVVADYTGIVLPLPNPGGRARAA